MHGDQDDLAATRGVRAAPAGPEIPGRVVQRGDPARELAVGRTQGSPSDWESFIAPFYVLPCTPDVCWQYGRVYRHLRRVGQLIGTNDLWIAATALAFELPIVTANERHYQRVPDLRVNGY